MPDLNENQPTHIDLCSGFCGFSIAAEWAGFRTVGFAEIGDYPSRLIAERFPGKPNWGDIRNTPVVRCDLITCGDPCQPFSCAGRKQGEGDDRYIWPAVLDAIGRHNPDWCVLENVVGIKGMVLSRRFDELAERGYQPEAFDIPSCASGLPSMERHIWTVAARDGVGSSWNSQSSVPRQRLGEWRKMGKTIQWWKADYGYPRKFDGRNLSESGVCRSVKGIPDWMERIKGIGNAVPPPIAYAIMRIIRSLI